MSKITLKVLKEKGASEEDIQCFKSFCVVKKQKEFTPVEFFKGAYYIPDTQLGKQRTIIDYNLVFQSIDTLQELRDVVDYYIQDEKMVYFIYRTFKFCHAIYKQDVELCKKAMQCYLSKINSRRDYSYLLNNCGEVLELLPDLHKALKNCVDSLNALDTMLK